MASLLEWKKLPPLLGRTYLAVGLAPTILAGNIGTPLISCVDRMTHDTVTVVELSSFTRAD